MKCQGITLVLLLCAFSAKAEDDSRICRESDLSGAYHIVSLQETPKGEEANWYQDYPNQYLTFGPGHTYSFVASLHPMTTADELSKANVLSASDGMHVFDRKYALDNTGVLNFYQDGKTTYSYRCMVRLKAIAHKNLGDMTLTGYSKNKTLLEKVFRRGIK
jgi:hypothetical protein